ncbi:MAG: 4Fe-4S dicluster domain-containing protein [Bacteroidales bacterium]|nr:4Fe-4S dicluster domain-containing protein [Bacteroidales bacterium]
MIDFGFSLSRSSAVQLDEVDLGLYKELERLEPDVRICMECGSCSATCTAGPWSGMSVRKVIHSLQRTQSVSSPAPKNEAEWAQEKTHSGSKNEAEWAQEKAHSAELAKIEKMLKGCMLCGKCSMVCPRGINTRHLILSLSRIYKEGR